MSPKIDPDHMTTAVRATSTPTAQERRARKHPERVERLFGELGFTGCSLRNVADSAGVNQGMIHYFFRSKEALFQETYLRCGSPLVEERMRLLDTEEAAAKGRQSR
ncbi:helix-turn-helix domain-containing protein [Achromobacter xylosoxidans]